MQGLGEYNDLRELIVGFAAGRPPLSSNRIIAPGLNCSDGSPFYMPIGTGFSRMIYDVLYVKQDDGAAICLKWCIRWARAWRPSRNSFAGSRVSKCDGVCSLVAFYCMHDRVRDLRLVQPFWRCSDAECLADCATVACLGQSPRALQWLRYARKGNNPDVLRLLQRPWQEHKNYYRIVIRKAVRTAMRAGNVRLLAELHAHWDVDWEKDILRGELISYVPPDNVVALLVSWGMPRDHMTAPERKTHALAYAVVGISVLLAVWLW